PSAERNWDQQRLRTLAEHWARDFAAQLPSNAPETAAAATRYVDLFVQDQGASSVAAAPQLFGACVGAPGTRSIVYGDGGSGKSTALLKLAADLARSALREESAPVPLYARMNLFDSQAHGLQRLLEILGSPVGLSADALLRLWRNSPRPLMFL